MNIHPDGHTDGNALAATALLRLGKLCGKSDYLDAAGRTLVVAAPIMQRMPTAVGQMLIALDLWLGPTTEVVLIGGTDESANEDAIATLQKSFLPRSVIAYRGPAAARAGRSAALHSLFASREIADTQPNFFICENFTCQAPIKGLAQIKAAIAKL